MAKKKSEFENPYEEKCSIVYAMSLIGAKWKIPILWHLAHYEILHYNELKRHLKDVTNTVLTRCLRELEQDSIVLRKSNESVPPSVTYELTDLGKELIPALNGLYKWGDEHKSNTIKI
jgi:DNA-binding HxlR family transcriptional regulator